MPTNLNPNDEEDSLASFERPRVTVDRFLEENPAYGEKIGEMLKEWAYLQAITTGQEFSKAVQRLSQQLGNRDSDRIMGKTEEMLIEQLSSNGVSKSEISSWLLENKKDIEGAFDTHYFDAASTILNNYIKALLPYAKGLPLVIGETLGNYMPHPVDDLFREGGCPDYPPDALSH